MSFFFNDAATTEIYTLSLHDALPICFRVGATNGIGAKYLARSDAKTVGILGSGWQAGTQLMALTHVRAIQDIKADRKCTRLNSRHANSSYAVFCLKKKYKIAWMRSRL